MFDDKKHALKDRPGQHRYAPKVLPYTVTPIDIPIEEWRKQRELKFAADEQRRQERFNNVVNRLQRSMNSQTDIEQSNEVKAAINSESETTRVQRRHIDIEKQRHAEYKAKIEAQQVRDEMAMGEARREAMKLTQPWYKRLWSKILDTFLNLDFNQ